MNTTTTTAPGWRAYSRHQVAEILNVPVWQVDAAIRRGDLPAFKVGKHVRVTDIALRKFAGLPEAA